MDDIEISKAFIKLYASLFFKSSYPNERPLLAHYTSINTLERIITTDEVWFSNPLFMNDVEEMRFGIEEGLKQIRNNDEVRNACGTNTRFEKLINKLDTIYFGFYKNRAELDTYVFCLSKHDMDDSDGLLSMWRGYGDNGNGAALVIDTNQFTYLAKSPLILSQVEYLSTKDRIIEIENIIKQFASILRTMVISDEQLLIPAWQIFDRIKWFALLTKHKGFSEEQEWRVIYMKELDVEKRLEKYCQYAIGKHGLEPKLKIPVGPIEGVTGSDHTLTKIIRQIILGPMVTGPLSEETLKRMLIMAKKPELSDRVTVSTIPFRSS